VSFRLLNIILDAGLVAAAVLIAIGWFRLRRVNYRNIRASEIDPNVSAGEMLLRDVMSEARLHELKEEAGHDRMPH
jgi:hypothetical protein